MHLQKVAAGTNFSDFYTIRIFCSYLCGKSAVYYTSSNVYKTLRNLIHTQWKQKLLQVNLCCWYVVHLLQIFPTDVVKVHN